MTLTAISLGWGVQSFALAAMSALGVLPPVDVAIHADTTHERAETYELAREMTPWLEARGVRVVTVKNDRVNVIENWTSTGLMIPVFHSYPDNTPSGMMRRQCTGDWKIAPIRRWLQANRNGAPVDMWLGITLDEVQRMKPADVKYITHRFPFIDALDRPWTRTMVLQWLQDNGLPIPTKSSCVFCPYHDRATWREIKMSGNGDWQKAVEVDRAIRDKRPGYKCYLSPERIPLDEVDFRNEIDHGQLTLWDEECEGMCFL